MPALGRVTLCDVAWLARGDHARYVQHPRPYAVQVVSLGSYTYAHVMLALFDTGRSQLAPMPISSQYDGPQLAIGPIAPRASLNGPMPVIAHALPIRSASDRL